MSLYHEAAAALSSPASDGGNLKTRIFGPRSKDSSKDGGKDGKDAKKITPAQIYALAAESCKWSAVLSEVIDRAELLVHERRRLTPTLALLLVHDLLIGKGGAVQLPANHGLRAAVERHKARLTAELTRARLRRKAPTLAALRDQVERDAAASVSASSLAAATRWVRVNTLKTTLDAQLATTFAGYGRVATLPELFARDGEGSSPDSQAGRIYVDEHVPNLVAVPLMTAPSSPTDLTRSEAYKSGAIIFQDKASCFPAYLLDPASLGDDGHVIDACAAPGNKTSHLAALLQECSSSTSPHRQVFAFEKDNYRAKTLHSMLQKAGAFGHVTVDAGQDFLRVDPAAERYGLVRALLLDPSCSGSGIVGRDAMPKLHLPKAVAVLTSTAATPAAKTPTTSSQQPKGKKRKRGGTDVAKDGRGSAKREESVAAPEQSSQQTVGLDDIQAKEDPAARLAALASFQLSLLLHAFSFPSARRVTYSTCSIHAQENEQVVVRALRAASQTPSTAGWRLLRRDEQVAGMRAWPIRGDSAGAEAVKSEDGDDGDDGDDEIDPAAVADACIRSYPDDDRGVMGFFVAAFVRDNVPMDKKNGAAAEKRPRQSDSKASTATIKPTAKAVKPKNYELDEEEWSGFDN